MRWLMHKNRILNLDQKSIESDVVGVVGQTGLQPAVVGFLEYHDVLPVLTSKKSCSTFMQDEISAF